MIKIGFLASHNGSAAHAITNACKTGVLKAVPKILISNNPNAGALVWSHENGLKTQIINDKNSDDVDSDISQILLKHGIDIVVCSGYMKLVGQKTINAVLGKILNVHPALLPLYGGHGMYGRNVHMAVFDNKDKQTGISIHLVDLEYDKGRILGQKIIPIHDGDTIDEIESKVKAEEPDFYIEILRQILSGEIILP